jgi:PAS domain S-box-containing protein
MELSKTRNVVADAERVASPSSIREERAVIAALATLALEADLNGLMEQAVERLKRALSVDYVEILELESDGQFLLLRAGAGWQGQGRAESVREDARTNSQAGLTLAAREPVVVNDLRQEQRFTASNRMLTHGITSGVTVLIDGQPFPFGVLGAYSRSCREFDLDDINVLRAAAGILAAAIRLSRSEEAVRSSEQLMRAIVNTLVDGLIVIDERGIMDSVNPAAEKLFGYSADEMTGRNVSMLMPQPYDREHDQYIRTYLQTGVAKIIGIGREVTGRRKDGSIFPLYLAVSELKLGGRRLFTGVARDLSELRRMEREVLQATSDEQRRIGQDLHDGLCQQLAGIAFAAEVFTRKLGSHGADTQTIQKIAHMIDEAITQARNLAHNLQPVTVDHEGLEAALRELTGKVESMFHVTCLFVCEQPCSLSDNLVANHLYRIVQEAVSNAVRHGKARTIIIELGADQDALRLAIKDNGVGIGNTTSDGRGIGLKTMQYRARIIGGSITISPGERGGTTVTCLVRRSNAHEKDTAPKEQAKPAASDLVAAVGSDVGPRKAQGKDPSRRRSSHRPRATGRAH